MSAISRFFLRAKHWQIFLLLFVFSFVAELLLIGPALSAQGSPQRELWRFWLSTTVMIVPFMFAFLAWFWSMGSFLNSIAPPRLRMNTAFFQFAVVYPGLYVFVALPLFAAPNPNLIVVIFPLHLFAMFCMFYNLRFVAKSLVSVETAKPASFYDYAGPFFLSLVFPDRGVGYAAAN